MADTAHKQGCDALGGYGNGVGACSCGADTQPLAPTDADIDALWAEQQLTVPQLVQRRAIARAVLSKWGADHFADASKTMPLPAGYALVPVEPTPEMVDAAQEAYMPFGDMQLSIQLAIAAAPPPMARGPLTLDEFRKAFHEYTGCIVGTNQGLLMAAKSATEHAHGITGAKT